MVFKENGWCELVIKIKFKITQLLVLYKKISTPSDSNIPPPDQYLNYFLGFRCRHDVISLLFRGVWDRRF